VGRQTIWEIRGTDKSLDLNGNRIQPHCCPKHRLHIYRLRHPNVYGRLTEIIYQNVNFVASFSLSVSAILFWLFHERKDFLNTFFILQALF
jgi:hypothetical protein